MTAHVDLSEVGQYTNLLLLDHRLGLVDREGGRPTDRDIVSNRHMVTQSEETDKVTDRNRVTQRKRDKNKSDREGQSGKQRQSYRAKRRTK